MKYSSSNHRTLVFFGMICFSAVVFLWVTSLAAATVSVERNIDVGGKWRTYRLFVPPGMEGPRPTIIIMHGGAGTAAGQERYSGFDNFAASHGIVAIYPQGERRHWNDGRRNGRQSSADDVAFIRAVISALVSESTIDPARVYAAGISNGGFMALHLACTIPGAIAGIAVIAAAQPADAQCASPRPMPVIFFHGTADRFVAIGGVRSVEVSEIGAARSATQKQWHSGKKKMDVERRSEAQFRRRTFRAICVSQLKTTRARPDWDYKM
jgi:polyhydroxybutyrate depolymerase